MEGPTPVSALIQAATMVTAGVYMIVRNHAIFDLSPVAMTTVAWIGGSPPFRRNDRSRTNRHQACLAYSTVASWATCTWGAASGPIRPRSSI